MFDFEKVIDGTKIRYNFTLDLVNILAAKDLNEKVDLCYVTQLIKDTKVIETIPNNKIQIELKKELLNCWKICSRLSKNTKKVALITLAIEYMKGHYALHNLNLTNELLDTELTNLKLRFNSSAVYGVNKSSLLDIDGSIKKKNVDKKLIEEVVQWGKWIYKNCLEVECRLWDTIYKQFASNPRNKKSRVLIGEYYDFLYLANYELVNKYGNIKANEIIDTFNTRLLKYM